MRKLKVSYSLEERVLCLESVASALKGHATGIFCRLCSLDVVVHLRRDDYIAQADVCVNAAWDCVFTIHTHISNPHASAMLAAVTNVDSACWRSER